MLAVDTRVRVRLDRECRYRHAAQADGRIGTIIAVVIEDVLGLRWLSRLCRTCRGVDWRT